MQKYLPLILTVALVAACSPKDKTTQSPTSTGVAPSQPTAPPVTLEAPLASEFIALQGCNESSTGEIECVLRNKTNKPVNIYADLEVRAMSYSAEGVKVDDRPSMSWGSIDAGGATKVTVAHRRTQPARIVIVGK